jgi:hypothetical protein
MTLWNYYIDTALDREDNVFLVYWSNADSQNYNIIIEKYNTNGEFLWKFTQDSGNSTIYNLQPKIDTDAMGSVYIVFPTMSELGETKTGLADIVLMKLTNSGSLTYLRQNSHFNGPDINSAPSISIDKNDPYANVYMTFNRSDGIKKEISVCNISSAGNLLWILNDDIFNTSTVNNDPKICVKNRAAYIVYYTEAEEGIVLFKLNTENKTLEWIKSDSDLNYIGNNEIPDLIVDSNSNIYICYVSDNTQTYGTGTQIIVVKINGDTGERIWITYTGTGNNAQYDDFSTIRLTRNDNPYICYTRTNTEQTDYAYNSTICVLRISVDGKIEFKQLENPTNSLVLGNDINPSLNIDSLDNIIIAYPTNNGLNGDDYEIVLFKLLTSGESAPSTTTDDTGNSYTAFSTDQNRSPGVNDIVVIKRDSGGTVLWTTRSSVLNTVENNTRPDIVCKGSEFLYIVYQTSGTTEDSDSRFPFDLVLAKLSTVTGEVLWHLQKPTFNTFRSDENPVIAIDQSTGDLFIAYQSTGRCNNGYRYAKKDAYDIIVFSVNSAGELRWIVQNRLWNSQYGAKNTSIFCNSRDGLIYVSYTVLSQVYKAGDFTGNSDTCLMCLTRDGTLHKFIDGDLKDAFFILTSETFNTEFFDDYSNTVIDESGNIFLCFLTTSDSGNFITICALNQYSGDVVKIKRITDESIVASKISTCYNSGSLYLAYSKSDNNLAVSRLNAENFNIFWTVSSAFNTGGDETDPSILNDEFGNVIVSFCTTAELYTGSNYNVYRKVVVAQISNSGIINWIN